MQQHIDVVECAGSVVLALTEFGSLPLTRVTAHEQDVRATFEHGTGSRLYFALFGKFKGLYSGLQVPPNDSEKYQR